VDAANTKTSGMDEKQEPHAELSGHDRFDGRLEHQWDDSSMEGLHKKEIDPAQGIVESHLGLATQNIAFNVEKNSKI
jgi:hypothetical protein